MHATTSQSLGLSVKIKCLIIYLSRTLNKKIRDGVYDTFQHDATKTDLWKCFFGIRNVDGSEADRKLNSMAR